MTGTTLYVASVAPLCDDKLYAEAYGIASDERKQKVDRLRFRKDKNLSLGVEILMRYAIKCQGVPDFSLRYGENGKPFINGCGIKFNLSHSGEYALCAVSGADVGCDIEKIAPIDLHVAKRFFFGSEYVDIASGPTEEVRTELFYRYWTLKESFMKATGLGMALPLDSFEITLRDGISVRHSVDGRQYSFRDFDCIDGYKCAVCTEGERTAAGATLKIPELNEIITEVLH